MSLALIFSAAQITNSSSILKANGNVAGNNGDEMSFLEEDVKELRCENYIKDEELTNFKKQNGLNTAFLDALRREYDYINKYVSENEFVIVDSILSHDGKNAVVTEVTKNELLSFGYLEWEYKIYLYSVESGTRELLEFNLNNQGPHTISWQSKVKNYFFKEASAGGCRLRMKPMGVDN